MKHSTLLLVATVVSAPALLHARPEFLARYMADPFARPEKSNCSTCHISPAGGGARNEFGRAFAAANFQITPALRAQFPAWFVPAKTAGDAVKVTWASGKEGQSIIQIGGDYYLADRNEGTVKKIDAAQLAAFSAPQAAVSPTGAAPATQAAQAQKPVDDLDSKTLATFDNYLVDLPTNRPRPSGELLMRFTHRFDMPITGKTGALRDLFGFDSVSSVSSFGVEGAINNHVSLLAYRMPIRGTQTIEMGTHISLLQQSKSIPFSLGVRATIEGQYNFTERYTTNFQPIISHAFGDRAEFFVVPTFSIAVPRRTLTFDFPINTGETRDNAGAIGLGGSIRIRPKVAIVGEWIPRVYGFRGVGTSNTYSLGIQRRTNRHVFGLIVTNNSFTTTSRSVISGQGDLRVGFNIARRLF